MSPSVNPKTDHIKAGMPLKLICWYKSLSKQNSINNQSQKWQQGDKYISWSTGNDQLAFNFYFRGDEN
jgi:hypothetical protein